MENATRSAWPNSIRELKELCKERGYAFFDEEVMGYHASIVRDTQRLHGGRAFYESTANPYEDDAPRRCLVKLVELHPSGNGYSIRTIGEVTAEAPRSATQAQSMASMLGTLVKSGIVPDRLEYGQDVALARFLGIDVQSSADGWVVREVRGRRDGDGSPKWELAQVPE